MDIIYNQKLKGLIFYYLLNLKCLIFKLLMMEIKSRNYFQNLHLTDQEAPRDQFPQYNYMKR